MRLVIGLVVGLIIGLIIGCILHSLKETLEILSLVAQIAVAVGTSFLAYMTYRSIEEVRVERLRKSFIAITKELHRVKDFVEDNVRRLGELLGASKVRWLVNITVGGIEISGDTIRTDFALYYKRGLKLLKLVDKCYSEIEKYNDGYQTFRSSLRNLIMEMLEKKNIGVDPSGYTYVCVYYDGSERKVQFVSPEECRKLSTSHVLSIDDHVEAVLVGLSEVLKESKREEEFYKELPSLYQEIRLSKQFKDSVNELKHKAKDVVACLNNLDKELSKAIEDIMKKYSISKQDLPKEQLLRSS